MIDEAKLRKLLLEVVTDLSHTVMPSYHTDELFKSLKAKIETADITDTGQDWPASFELYGEAEK